MLCNYANDSLLTLNQQSNAAVQSQVQRALRNGVVLDYIPDNTYLVSCGSNDCIDDLYHLVEVIWVTEHKPDQKVNAQLTAQTTYSASNLKVSLITDSINDGGPPYSLLVHLARPASQITVAGVRVTRHWEQVLSLHQITAQISDDDSNRVVVTAPALFMQDVVAYLAHQPDVMWYVADYLHYTEHVY